MALSTQPYKGTRDFYPEDMRTQRWMFERMRQVVHGYGYQEYDGPVLEPLELYAAKTGDEIVSQQLYSFMDRGERNVAIRPEMTPTLARMVAGKINELPRPVRWYSIPNCMRYERPQRGRLREFWQLNVDVLGGDPLLADAECLMLALDLMRAYRGEAFVSIRVNNRRLVDDFFRGVGLDADTAMKVTKAIDARAKIGEEKYQVWLAELGVTPEQRSKMELFFKAGLDEAIALAGPDSTGARELRELFRLLKDSGASSQIVFDPAVLRGLDYYTGTVFEMYDVSPENNRALFGGGRYDNLIGLFGKHRLSGVGFGMGDVTLRQFLETHGLMPNLGGAADVYVGLPSLETRTQAELVARALRGAGLRVVTPLEAGGFGDQLKQANKLGARFVVLFGEVEMAEGKAVVKDLSKGSQQAVTYSEVAKYVSTALSTGNT